MSPSKEVEMMISSQLSDNQEQLEKLFTACDDFEIIPWQFGPDMSCHAFSAYLTSLVLDKKHNYMKETIQDLVTHEVGPGTTIHVDDVVYFFENQGISSQSAIVLEDFDQAVEQILNGNLVIFFDTCEAAICYHAITLESRNISEPVNEPSVLGPREGTIEDLETNIGLLRKRLKNTSFKLHRLETGKSTRTTLAYGYMEGAVDPETLTEFKNRLSEVQSYDIVEPTYLEDLIEDSSYSPFPQYRFTERPDVAVAALLDGKIIVMTQGSPSILICPGLFVEFFSTAEDYYQRTVHASLIRLLRIGAFLMALTLPSIYIAFSTFHPELLPTVLLLAILDTREGIPFPAFIEAFLMEFFFELLREAGIRLPKPVGSAVSIVGALVIGQAAIQAKIASPMMVIVVAATGIASFSLPQYNLAITLRILRFPLMMFSAALGGFGLMIGFLLTLLHLTSLRSLGQPYLADLAPFKPKEFRDVLIRAPLKQLLRSPRNQHRHQRPKNE
jgi:spore germination protein